MHRLRSWLRAAFRRRALDREMRDEIDLHLERATARMIARGMSPADAQRAARREFGNVAVVQENARDARGAVLLESVLKDVRFAARTLVRSPVFTLVAVLSLALGIGANTAIFGVIYGLMLERLSVPHPEQLVQVRRADDRGNATDEFSLDEYHALQATRGLELAAFTGAGARPVVIGGVEQQQVGDMFAVDGAFFLLLRIAPAAGRLLTHDDDDRAAPAAVVSWDLAQRNFGSATAAVGRTITLGRATFTIVGVTPRRFHGLGVAGSFGIATPLRTATRLLMPPARLTNGVTVNVVGRTIASDTRGAQAAIALAFQRCCAGGQLTQRPPGRAAPRGEHAVLTDISRGIPPAKADLRELYARVLFALMGGVAVLLLIACANVGNLLLARATARTHELSVRLALGASQGRLIRQLLVESTQIAGAGAAVGLLIALWGTSLLARHLPANLRPLEPVVALRPNPVLFAFTALVAIACTTIFGVLPAIRATRVDPIAGLRQGARRAGGRTGILDRGIVAVQVALALVLVTSAALLVQTLRNLRNVDAGFETAHLLLADVEVRGTRYAQTGMRPLYGDMLRRVRALPGVQAAGMATRVPLVYGAGPLEDLYVPGYEASAGEEVGADYISATPGFLAGVGIKLRIGRDIGDGDGASAPHVAILSEQIAEKYFAGRNPVGATIRRGADGEPLLVIGVAADAKFYDMRGLALPTIYIPFEQSRDWGFLALAARTTNAPDALIPAVRGALTASAPGVTVRWVQRMDDAIDRQLAREQTLAWLAAVFGTLALVLAAAGLYGVVAYQVTARAAEIGVRMALGADAVHVVWMVLRQSLAVVGVGAIFGIPLALGGARAIAAQLYGVTPWHPATLGGVVLALLVVGALASLLPARRAARVDPLIAIRAE